MSLIGCLMYVYFLILVWSNGPTSNPWLCWQFSQTVNIVASLNRIELQIQTKFEGRESHTPLHPHLDLPPQGQIEMPLDLDRALDLERVTALELGSAPSPPLPKFRIDADNFSGDSCSDVIKSRASIFFFPVNQNVAFPFPP